MSRREWTFQRPAPDLAAAAAKQQQYHHERLTWWEEEREKVNEAIGSAGVQLRRHPVTGGERHEIVIDPTLSGRLAECERKIEQHRLRSDEYARWYAMLKAAGEKTYELTHYDWQFFFGLKGDEDE